MAAAIYHGLISGEHQSINPHCPSGNCTWPITPSLAVCGGCEEPEFSLVNCYNHSNHYGFQPNGFCNYSLASGLYAELYDVTKLSDLASGPYPGFHSISYLRGPAGQDADPRVFLCQMELFGFPFEDGRFQTYDPTLIYHHCSIWACVQYIQTSVRFGQLYENVVSIDDSNWPSDGKMIPFGVLNATRDTDKQIQFAASFAALTATWSYLMENLNGSVGISSTGKDFSNENIRWIWNGATHADTWIKGISTRMTNVLRLNQTQTQRDEYKGVQFELAVKVRWPWVVLPVVLVISSIAFMFTVIARTASSTVCSWKGSPLTTLIFGLDTVLLDTAKDRVEERDGINKAVGMRKFRLSNMQDGRRMFVGT